MQTTWWDRHAIEQMETFINWIGDETAPSKVQARNYVITSDYCSILDCGCGTCSEYLGYAREAPHIDYHGIDSCKALVDLARRKNIPNVIHGDLEALPFPDNSVDVVFIRHVLEHLDGYQSALQEAIRVARREVLVVWFLPCTDDDEVLNWDPAENLRHNRYNRKQVEEFLTAQKKVESFRWEECGNKAQLHEEMLHVMMRA